MKAFKIALATALLATGGAASAQSAGDGQCLVVSNAFAGQAKEEQARKIAEASVYFYLGRIGNAMTTEQLKILLDAQAKTLNPQNASQVMQRCLAAIQTKAEMLKALGPKPAAAKPAPAKPATAKGSPEGR